MDTKACPICETVKSLTEFHAKPNGHSRGCQKCVLSPNDQEKEIAQFEQLARRLVSFD